MIFCDLRAFNVILPNVFLNHHVAYCFFDNLGDSDEDHHIDLQNGPGVAYESMIDLHILRKDQHQVLLVNKLEELYQRIKNHEPYKPSFVGKVSGYTVIQKHFQSYTSQSINISCCPAFICNDLLSEYIFCNCPSLKLDKNTSV